SQKDLGTFICEKSAVTAGTCEMYSFPATGNGTATESLSDASEWTSTGLYALPGKSITVTRTDSNSAAAAGIFFNFQRVGSSRSVASYDRPQFMQSPAMLLKSGESRTFTTPYGGPIYLRLNGNSTVSGTSVSFSFTGVAKHAAVLDIGDSTQAQAFITDVQTNPLPHVDIRGEGFEAHMRIDKFLNSVNAPINLSQKRDGTSLTIDYSGDVEQLFSDYRDYFVGAVYNLAGFKLPGENLSNTLSTDVQSICQNFSWDCTDESIHRRNKRQHANYDQYANCGSGCSGNPYDAAWNISALGWGDSHELGHNLQTKPLNAHWVPEANRNDWSAYSNRAGENSNNIFPYNTVWNYYRKVQSDDLEITDGHMNHKELFAVIQSDLAGLTQNINGVSKKVIYNQNCDLVGSFDASSSNNRYSVIWENSAYAADNGKRMSFLLQLPVMLDKKTMRDGTTLQHGMDIFTLLYSQSRIFAQAAQNATDWDSARDALGFGLFPYEGGGPYGGLKVKNIPGNDFLLVALGFITGLDWRTYFDLRGVRYSDLAAQQVAQHTTDSIITSTVGTAFAVLDTELPALDMSAVQYVHLDGVSTWPKDGWHPSQCLPTP
ncbi:MAG: ImpA family metalloprotease, partial [Candidatus Electrothrix sp.]